MAAALISQSYNAASDLYASAITSLHANLPALPIPSSISISIPHNVNPMIEELSVYTSQFLHTPVSLQSVHVPIWIVTLPDSLRDFFLISLSNASIFVKDGYELVSPYLDTLTAWQKANIIFFIFTVGILSWMLDSHHEEIPASPLSSTNPFENSIRSIPQPSAVKGPIQSAISKVTSPPRRRQSLDTIAKLATLEDASARLNSRRSSIISLSPAGTLSLPTTAPRSPIPLAYTDSTATSPADIVRPPAGQSTTLLTSIASTRARQTLSTSSQPASGSIQALKKRKSRRRSTFGATQAAIKKQMREVVEEYESSTGAAKVEDAERRRRKNGSWKTALLLGLRVPVGWTMK